MLFSDSYLTIEKPCEALTKERGSKFLAFAFPVTSELEIKEHLAGLKKQHPGANHHCYAWRLGPDKQAFRANDDGEPANTAGKPILAQIQARDLTNVLVVVVRYFGGTLLGVGGLIAAYRAAAAEVLQQAVLVEKFIYYEYRVSFDSEEVSSVMRLLKELQAEITANTYDEQSHVHFLIKKQYADVMTQRFANIYKAKLEFKRVI